MTYCIRVEKNEPNSRTVGFIHVNQPPHELTDEQIAARAKNDCNIDRVDKWETVNLGD